MRATPLEDFLTFGWVKAYVHLPDSGDMNKKTRTTGSIAVSAALLAGAGAAAATAPAQAAPVQATKAASAAQLSAASVGKSAVKSPTIVYRSAKANARVSIAKAPKVSIAKKKAKKRYRSKRS